MKVVGLTGGIGSGKSTVARHFRGLGVPTLDADQLARDAVAAGSRGLTDITAAFGTAILGDDGTLNRKALSDIVFRDVAARERLNRIVHPQVRRLFRAELERHSAAGTALLIYEVPLLFEKNLEAQFDATVVVAVSPETQLRRIHARDGLDAPAAKRRVDAQLRLEEKVARADYVLWNDQDEPTLAARIEALLRDLLAAS